MQSDGRPCHESPPIHGRSQQASIDPLTSGQTRSAFDHSLKGQEQNGDGSTTSGGGRGLTGYSVVDAADLAAATDLAKGCPLLADGGSVDVYATIDM